MGIRVRADDEIGLVKSAAEGLYSAIGELQPVPGDCTPFSFARKGRDNAVLLRDFLTELLILFERDHRMLTSVQNAELSDGRLSVSGASSPVDADGSVLSREVKAVTYHGLALSRKAGEYEATLIVDI